MHTPALTGQTLASLPLSQRLLLAAGTLALGLALIFCAGFAHSDILHNAAHDTRHSAAFPCH